MIACASTSRGSTAPVSQARSTSTLTAVHVAAKMRRYSVWSRPTTRRSYELRAATAPIQTTATRADTTREPRRPGCPGVPARRVASSTDARITEARTTAVSV